LFLNCYTHHQGNERYQQRYTTNEPEKNGKHSKTYTSPTRITKGTNSTLVRISGEKEKEEKNFFFPEMRT
jgi:hypothetical protein